MNAATLIPVLWTLVLVTGCAPFAWVLWMSAKGETV